MNTGKTQSHCSGHHNSGNHDHSVAYGSLRTAFFLNLAFTLIEIVGGILTNSVAILSDAVHDLGDSLAFGLAWWLEYLSDAKAPPRFTYGYKRLSLLGSLITSVILVAGSALILIEAIPRLFQPEAPQTGGMIGLAILGVAVNGFAMWKTHANAKENVRAVSLHLLEDVLGWIAVLVGATIIALTGWNEVDALLSIGITLFIVWGVVRRLRSIVGIFLQEAPAQFPLIAEELSAIGGVISHHDTHLWSLDGGQHVLTTHLVIDRTVEADQVKQAVRALGQQLGISHVTVEIEYEGVGCSADLRP